MKPDQNYIDRLEPGDRVHTTKGEAIEITGRDRDGSIRAATTAPGDKYLRLFDKRGRGNLGADIQTP